MPEPDPETARSYPYRLIRDREGGFVAEHVSLGGCISQGETADEAVENLDDARALWLETRRQADPPFPPSPEVESFSGRTSLRLPVFVHADLARGAERRGLSLNRLLNRALAGFVEGGSVEAAALALDDDTEAKALPARDLPYYLSLDYPYELTRDAEAGGFFAEHVDLEGCASQGETAREAVANLDEARGLWIETRMEDDLPIPEPLSQDHSGYISLRMNPALHGQLAVHAAQNGVSLNQFLAAVLAGFAGAISGRDVKAGRATKVALEETPATSLPENYSLPAKEDALAAIHNMYDYFLAHSHVAGASKAEKRASTVELAESLRMAKRQVERVAA